MKRYKKKDILKAIETLAEANRSIAKAADTDRKGALEVLAGCQELAILAGNHLETRGEASASIVNMLEEYCEGIYQMSENISDAVQLRKLFKHTDRLLTKIQNAITHELKDKKEVVFLPYKASMWDSLESVWKAADADEETDAYVIPIPYYDRNPDGSFREMHYEGELYPDYVPVTHYDAYDMEERRPDAIYIHNPYDNCNYVTSVEPYYYAENLLRFTEKLVYIPYFVLGEIDPEDQTAIDGMKHFCFVPGVIYAHKVIVQSENMRQIYINEFIKEAKRCGMSGEHTDRTFLEKKILGLGSPKIDKILNTKKEDLEIPDEWLRIIKKPDGSWKKIIFYNTSVGALLGESEQMLLKIKSVFQTFKEYRNEIALLWRPHPLIENTLKSISPRLWETYQNIRDGYLQEGWGIYDDTADIDRAVVISDAYYGDSSSVVQMYRKTGKPIMIQSVFIVHY